MPPGANSQVQSPTHRRVHRSISATSTNPSRRASSGGETLSEYWGYLIIFRVNLGVLMEFEEILQCNSIVAVQN